MKESILKDLENLQRELAAVIKSTKEDEYWGSQGGLYVIRELIPPIINKLKEIAPNL